MSRLVALCLCCLGIIGLAPARAEHFEWEGTRIEFADLGRKDGEVVVSLHGWLGSSEQIVGHETTKRLVERGFRVIAPGSRLIPVTRTTSGRLSSLLSFTTSSNS